MHLEAYAKLFCHCSSWLAWPLFLSPLSTGLHRHRPHCKKCASIIYIEYFASIRLHSIGIFRANSAMPAKWAKNEGGLMKAPMEKWPSLATTLSLLFDIALESSLLLRSANICGGWWLAEFKWFDWGFGGAIKKSCQVLSIICLSA